jgi:hypothetical protein
VRGGKGDLGRLAVDQGWVDGECVVEDGGGGVAAKGISGEYWGDY